MKQTAVQDPDVAKNQWYISREITVYNSYMLGK